MVMSTGTNEPGEPADRKPKPGSDLAAIFSPIKIDTTDRDAGKTVYRKGWFSTRSDWLGRTFGSTNE